MKPGTRVRLVALPVELWTPWPDGAMPAEEVARLAGELATVIQGSYRLPDGCVLLVTDATGVSAADDYCGVPTLYGLIIPVAALAEVTESGAASSDAPPRRTTADDARVEGYEYAVSRLPSCALRFGDNMPDLRDAWLRGWSDGGGTIPHARPLPDPWRPGAHDEERLAVGGRLQSVTCDAHPGDVALPEAWRVAPGGAGCWRFTGYVAMEGHAPWTTRSWIRWIIPVQP